MKTLLVSINANSSKLVLVIILAVFLSNCSQSTNSASNTTDGVDYFIAEQIITVDGNIDDWNSISSVQVNSKENLWIGDGLLEENWGGEADLSFSWKACHNDGKLFFLIQVKDDSLSNFDQKYTWQNDCAEIHLDHQNLGGHRIVGIEAENGLSDRMGKRLLGHEMHFLPTSPPIVYFDDSKIVYTTDSSQIESYSTEWLGEIAVEMTNNGYLMEIGFAVPNFYVRSGAKIGLDVTVCDDDGQGRKSLMVSSGSKGPFWVSMDEFHLAELE